MNRPYTERSLPLEGGGPGRGWPSDHPSPHPLPSREGEYKMQKLFFLILIFFSLVGFFVSCGNNATDTPPIVSPNDREDVPPPGDGDEPAVDQGVPELFPDDPEVKKCNPQEESCPEDTAATLIHSLPEAFRTGSPVSVGVLFPARFWGKAPLVGPPVLGHEGPFLSDQMMPKLNGSISFGVYIHADVTPGTYTFYAQQGARRATTTITILDNDE
ncbi:MAG TPA: hypothetical protein DDW49_08865 [Deltaproteobacteria bacterium]|nr:MAG: hypothetical protein A2048_00330 [Deltaproteobacteria bacterium GWA2_45_12]HBF13474.1 hypothetical protein [Deltaproteobacteria bacterium]